MTLSKIARSLMLLACAITGGIEAAATPPEGLPAILLTGRPLHLTCERREAPLGIDATKPRLGWWVGDDRPNAMQAAYQIFVASSEAKLGDKEKPDVWDSGKVASDQSVDVAYGGPQLVSARRYFWKVRTWGAGDDKPSAWSETSSFETGLLAKTDWTGKWISAPARDTTGSAPAVYLRKTFVLNKSPASVRVYATARGLFELRINGERVGQDYFTPGWTDYHKRNQYLTYDITGKTIEGLNVIGGVLGDGWHNGNLLLIRGPKKNWYGEDTSLLAQVIVRYRDGSTETFGTDGSWQATTNGPVVASDLYNGETYDARKELEVGGLLWDAQGYEGKDWAAAREVPAPDALPVAKVNYPIRPQGKLVAKTVKKTANGEWVFDFGQEIAGWARIHVRGKNGQTVTLRFAEMLDPDGSLHTGNLRSAKATDQYTFGVVENATWEPHFTYHGFRYVGLSGLDYSPDTTAVEAIVVHNAMPQTGYLATSDASVNRLQSNILWSQRGNAYDFPTDCPQRDERLGWTGDANFFLPTATFNYDEAAFIEKWMADLRDAQKADGRFTVYAPAPDEAGDPGEAAGYSDGGVICPWIIYEQYGDEKILADNYAAMKAWIEFQRKSSTDLIRPRSGYGDWLAPGTSAQNKDVTPRDLIATLYFAHTTDLVRRTAEILGHKDEAAEYGQLHTAIIEAMRKKYLGPDGKLIPDSPTAYAMALAHDLLPEASREAAVKHLVEALRANDWKMATGFVGTPILMRVLKRFHQDDAAYHLVLQHQFPGWMYMIDQGATTIWERWNSWTPETGFGEKIGDTGVGDIKMNSFNHTVWGAVGEWLYAVTGGIDLDPRGPGFRRIVIRPRPGGTLTFAKAQLDTPYGRVTTDWKRDGAKFVLQVNVPPNTRALVDLPDGKTTEVGAGAHHFEATLSQE